MFMNKRILLSLLILFIVSLFLSACSKLNNVYPPTPNDVSGTLFLKGYMISGSEVNYWALNIKSGQINQLNNLEYKDILESKYYITANNNPDDLKLKRHYLNDRLSLKWEDIYAFMDILKTFFLSTQCPANSQDENDLYTLNGQYRIVSNHTNNTIRIYNIASKLENTVKMRNYFYGQTLSPDSTYLAFFEHQPYAFSDGSVYEIRILNLKNAKIYAVKSGQISLPSSMVWVDSTTGTKH
jgi:hypothetical protein